MIQEEWASAQARQRSSVVWWLKISEQVLQVAEEWSGQSRLTQTSSSTEDQTVLDQDLHMQSNTIITVRHVCTSLNISRENKTYVDVV